MQQPLIEFDNVALGYGKRVIQQGITFTIRQGEYLGLVGPNGAGKTTILRAILGTISPLQGQIRLGSLRGSLPRFGYVPQRETLDAVLPYSAEEVVMMGRYRSLGLIRRPGSGDQAIVGKSLDHVDALNLRGFPFKDLSGGQKQRVLIARALAMHPDLLVLDEPTNGMDLSSRLAILDLISRLHRETSLTVIMVSHLLDDVANHVKRLAVVEPGLFQIGNVEEILTDANLSSMYGMPVEVTKVRGRTVILSGGGKEHD